MPKEATQKPEVTKCLRHVCEVRNLAGQAHDATTREKPTALMGIARSLVRIGTDLLFEAGEWRATQVAESGDCWVEGCTEAAARRRVVVSIGRDEEGRLHERTMEVCEVHEGHLDRGCAVELCGEDDRVLWELVREANDD